MRAKPPEALEKARVRTGHWGSDASYGMNGAFEIIGPSCAKLRIIASDGVDPEAQNWEHVSVSCDNRCPNWPEMCFVKDLFWGLEETVVQFHPPRSEYVNFHPRTLHMWRHRANAFVVPPSILVGPK